MSTADEVLAGLMAPAGQADPYPLYRRLHELGPATVAGDGTLLVSGYQACSALLRDHRLRKAPERLLAAAGFPDWPQRPSLRMMFGSILLLNPPEHTRLRRVVAAAFTARRVAALRPAVQRIVAEACGQLAGESDFVASFAFPVPVNVIGELLGIPASDRPMFQALVRDWATVLEMLSPLAVDRADAAAATIDGYLSGLAAERRRRPADDLITALTAGTDGEALTDNELVTMAALLLAAGFETTTGLLSNGLVALLSNPDSAERLRVEPALAEPATEELLRYDSPVQMLFGRTAPEDLEISGIQLSAGQRTISLLGAANRDPEVFEAPDRLMLDRHGPAPLSFGGGIHYCLGAPLARLEGQVAFGTLLTTFRKLALAGAPVPREGIALHGHTSLPVSAR